MPEPTTVLGKSVPNDGFVHLVAGHIRNRAELARASMGDAFASPSAPRHVAALEALADYLVGLSPDDQRVYALHLLQGLLHGDTDKYEPGRDVQVTFLTTIGDGTHVPRPNEALNEYVAAGIEDTSEQRQRTSRKVAALENKVKDYDKLQGELAEAKDKITSLKDELREARADANTLRDQRDYLRARVPDDAPSEPAGSDSASSSGDGGLARGESEVKEKAVA